MLRKGGCEGRGRDESIRSEQASGVGGGRAGETRRGGRWPVGGRDEVPIKTSRAIPTHGGAGRADFAKVSMGKKGEKEMHPLETSRALKRISAHIQMADGARVPGVRMVADGAWVRVDIATNK